MSQSPSQPPASNRPSRVNLTAIGIGLAVSLLAVVAAAHFHQAGPSEEPKTRGIVVTANDVTISADAPQWDSIRLGKAAPVAERWTDAFPGHFKVNEAQAARVGAPLAGHVSRVLIEIGDPVKSGDKLFTVVSSDVAALREEQERASVELAAAKATQERVQAMVDGRALPGKDAFESEQRLRESQLALQLANAKLASLRVSATGTNEFSVTAPRDGVVVEKNLLPAQQVSADEVLMEVADMSSVWAVAEIFESEAAGIKSGTPARLSSSSLPGFDYQGKVAMVSSVVDSDRHTVAVRVIVPNPDRQLRPNTYLEVSFREETPVGAVEVSATALVSDGADRYIYVQVGTGHFVRRKVVAGSAHDSRCVVLSGLAPGDVVVEEGSALLDNELSLSN